MLTLKAFFPFSPNNPYNSGTVIGKGNKERIISVNAKLLNDIYKF